MRSAKGANVKANIAFSEGGVLHNGLFFQVMEELPHSSAESKRQDRPQGAFVLNPLPRGKEDDYLWVEVGQAEMDKLPSHVCPRDSSHIVTPLKLNVSGDVWGGPEISPFVGDSSYAWFFVTEQLAQALRKSRLKGFRLDPYKVLVNQSLVKEAKLFVFQAVGLCCERIPMVVEAKNACPYCGQEPLVCQECGYFPFVCPKCRKTGFIGERDHEGKDDPRLICDVLRPKEGYILEGSRWDGSDFIGCRTGFYMSRRAKEWLEATHAGPLVVAPARFCLDGMTDEQKQQLEEVNKARM